MIYKNKLITIFLVIIICFFCCCKTSTKHYSYDQNCNHHHDEVVEANKSQEFKIVDEIAFSCEEKSIIVQPEEIHKLQYLLVSNGLKKCIINNAAKGVLEYEDQLLQIIQLENQTSGIFAHKTYHVFRGKKVFELVLKLSDNFECYSVEYGQTYYSYYYRILSDMIESIEGLDLASYMNKEVINNYGLDHFTEILNNQDKFDCNQEMDQLWFSIISDASRQNKIELKPYLPKQQP